MSAIDVDMEAVYVARIPPDDVEDGPSTVVLRQIEVIERRMDEVAVLLLGTGPGSARAVARLNFEWSTLEAWLELLSSSETTRESIRRLWNLSPLASARTRLRRLLQQGAVYGQEPDAPLGLIAQLHRLAAKLKAHEGIVGRLVNEGAGDDAQSTVIAMYGVAHEF